MSMLNNLRRTSEWLRRVLTERRLCVLVMSLVIGVLAFLWHYELLSEQWLIGLAFSLVLGTLVTTGFYAFMRWWVNYPPKPKYRGIPSWLTGLVERVVFTLAIGLTDATEAPITPIAMLGWLGLKLAVDWTRPVEVEGRKPTADEVGWRASGAMLALLTGLISMAFAFGGGLLSRLPN